MRGGRGLTAVTTWQWRCGQPSHPGQFEHSSAAAAGHGDCGEGGAAVGHGEGGEAAAGHGEGGETAAGHGEGGERGGSGDQHPAAVQLLHPAPAAAGPGPGQAGDSAGPR